MTSPSKRDVERDIEALQSQTTGEEGHDGIVFKTESGNYYDGDGNQIDDLSDVIFVVPPSLWHEWNNVERFEFTLPPE